MGRLVLKPFLVLFVCCCYIILLFMTDVYHKKVARQEEIVRLDQSRDVSLREGSLLHDFTMPFDDVRILAEIISHCSTDGLVTDERLMDGMKAFAKYKGRYGQVRFLDNNAKEVFRINRDKNGIVLVPDDELQQKGHRDYVINSANLQMGEVYVSPLDLNIENKEIETPFVPVIRFTSPAVDANGEKQGLMVLNYYVSQMLSRFEASANTEAGEVMLLNSQGYWLVAEDTSRCWTFMFADKPQRTFQAEYPHMWERMQEQPVGQAQTEDGLFTWSTVNPTFSIFNAQDEAARRQYVSVSPYSWIVVQHVSADELTAMNVEIYQSCTTTFVIICGITAVFLWMIIYVVLRTQRYSCELERLAHYDWLTGLSNLPHFFGELEQACAAAQQDRSSFALVYFDLDEFKFINDSYGHSAGNEVLKYVSSVLLKNIQDGDVAARIGGDEFVLLLRSIKNITSAELFVRKILLSLESPYTVECGSNVYIKSSVGIVVWDETVLNAGDILKRADSAMYISKEEGKHNYSVYERHDEPIAV